MKFRSKVFLVLGLTGGIPMVVTAALTWQVVTTAHRDDVAKLESATLNQKASEIQSYIDGSLLSFPKLVINTGLSQTVPTSVQMRGLQQTVLSLPNIRTESFISPGGRETFRIDQDNPNGYPESQLRDMSLDPAYVAVWHPDDESGKKYLGPITVNATDTVVEFGLPVKNDSGTLIGAVVGTASVEPITAIIQGSRIGNNGYLYLVTQSGAEVGVNTSPTSVASLPSVVQALAGKDLLTPETQMRYTGAQGVPVVAAAKAIVEHGSNWALIAEWPISEADAAINNLLLLYGLFLGALIIVVVFLSSVLAFFLVRPIRKLEIASERVSKGRFIEGVSITTGDEFQELGDAFNTMVMDLKEFEQLKDEFVFVAAHELRTPVAAMKGYLSLILDGTTGAISDGTRAFIEKVINSNNRLIQLVNDLLEVARSQAGRLTIKVAPIPIAPAISGTLDELKALADEKSVALVYVPPSDLPNVLADSDRVKEVVVNLVGNAIKYMGGAGTVTITHAVKEGMLMTNIADTGLGMSKEAQEKLFQKFYRVQTDKTKDITGTGLGLFIVKEIIEKMNGTLGVVSEEGKGSVFSFGLRIADGSNIPQA